MLGKLLKEMSKMLKWAPASAGMALIVCHSAEYLFARKTSLLKFADKDKRG